MADEEAPPPPVAPAVPLGRRRAAAIAKWIGVALASILVLFAAFLLWLNSEMGHSFVVRQINKLQMASGLQIHVGRIEGSLFSDLTLHDLRLSDQKGPFFTATEAKMGWRPLAYFGNHIDIRSLTVPRAHLYRLPQLKPSTQPNQPLLPNIDIDIGRLKVDRIMVDPAVTGYRHLLTLDGSAKIASGRAQVTLFAGAIAAPNLPGGDRMLLKLDAVPDKNKLDMGLQIHAPGNGFVASLAHWTQPLEASVNGKGSWANWNGRAIATLGGKAFADIAIGGRNGTFTLTGPLSPGLMMAPGLARRLVEPSVQMNLVAALDHRRADTKLRLSSPTIGLAAEGLVDLGRNEFTNMKVAARLSRPGAVLPNLSGRDVQLAMVLNGAFRTPVVAYRLTAATLGFNGTNVEGLEAVGRARVNTDRITVPVVARARRITGLNPTFGGLLTNVTLNGTVNIAGTKLLSDDLRIRSDKLNATAVIVADLATGTYQGGIQGRVNNFLVQGIGLLDIDTHLNVVTAGKGFGIRGKVAVRTRRIDNASARGVLEGNATATADVVMDPNGIVRIANLRLSSPGLRVTSGSGTYTLRTGAIDFRGTGVSRSYGALAVIVTGTASRPNIQLRAANPGFGIGLRNVSATVRSTPAGYAIAATGESNYGPFAADLTILSGRGPTTFDIHRLTFAGMTFAGRVVQTRAGPFAGTLTMTGRGLNGTVVLAAIGKVQRADVNATANGAEIPGANPILIQRGLVQATIILYPNAPQISGDVQLAGVRSSNFFIAQARVRGSYQNGSGTAQAFAEGTSGVPFRIGLNAALTPDLIRAAMQGSVDNIPFHLAQPAQIQRTAGTWVLTPTQVILPQGNVLLAGRYGASGYELQSRMEGLDLSILNVVSPTLGVGGKATGSLDFSAPAGAPFPRAEARLNIAGFSRTGVATRSPPVDLSLLGTLQPTGAALDAVIRRDAAIIGRAQVRLQPVGAGGSWMTRMLAAPLSGGIRYNGPAEVLSAFAGLADQQLSGPIAVGADFSGRLDNPQLNGIVRANNLTFVDEQYGTRITGVALQGRFTSSSLQIEQLSGHAGRGTISGTGTVGFAHAAGYPIDIRMHMQDAQLARSDNLAATVTGDLSIINNKANGALISGNLNVANLRYEIIRQGAAQVIDLQGVRRKGEPLPDPAKIREAQSDEVPSIWKLDLRVHADNQLYISGMGLESEWSGNLRIRGTTATPQLVGRIEVVRGTFSFSGQRFDLTTGIINFTGARPPDPQIQMQATADISNVTVNINVTGTAEHPNIAFSSDPALPQDEIMARVLFGGSVSELSVMQVASIASSLNSLRGSSGGGLNPLGKLRQASGLSRLRILGADQSTGRGTALAAGFYLSNKIYIELITDAQGYTATQIELSLSKTLSLLSAISSQGSNNNVNLRYRKRY